MPRPLRDWKDKALFTPGPLTTSPTVKQALLRDLGSRDGTFIDCVADIRRRLVALAGPEGLGLEAVLMQGSGTFAVEATIAAAVPRDGRMLVVANGAYGVRITQICEVLGINCEVIRGPENNYPDLDLVAAALSRNRFDAVAAVHCETTTGLFNPVEAIGALARAAGATYVVDAMSSFGAVPIDFDAANIDFLVSSANKCIEGVPGFGFVLARREALQLAEGRARSLSLDLFAQWRGLEGNGQFRFTPPTQVLLAFHQALVELEEEGGVAGRAARYRANHRRLVADMTALGFDTYLPPELQGYIITSFRYPTGPNWDFEAFYTRLSDRGYVIYPGKVSDADCFRIGNIGRLFEADIRGLTGAIRDIVGEMNFQPGAR